MDLAVWKSPAPEDLSPAIDYTLAPHVSLATAEDGTARLLNMGGGFYALPAVGAEMLRAVLEQGSAAAVPLLAQRYQVGADRVQADLQALLQQLRQQGVVQQGRPRRDGGAGLALVLGPCLSIIQRLSFGWVRAFLVLTLAKLSLLCFGWGRTVTAWQRCLQRFIPRGRAPVGEQAVRSLDQTVRRIAVSHILPMACKERSLACWALLRWAGSSAALVVGLEFLPLMGHCWCEAGPWIVSDYDDNCEFYTPVARYELLAATV
ncbi:MAG TPA: lasso peptide biosynthesis B2 protein [Gemmataceae bacterium]|nr:lasso peptide biosynthesis B2 protein [Gemmataceae bacterium]